MSRSRPSRSDQKAAAKHLEGPAPRPSLSQGTMSHSTHLPPGFLRACGYWRLADVQAVLVWTALAHSTDPRAIALREGWEGASVASAAGMSGLPPQYTPKTVIEVLEGLVSERLLARGAANSIERRVMAHVGPAGQWC